MAVGPTGSSKVFKTGLWAPKVNDRITGDEASEPFQIFLDDIQVGLDAFFLHGLSLYRGNMLVDGFHDAVISTRLLIQFDAEV